MLLAISNPFSADWLKYGFSGLVAIVIIATFYLIRHLIAHDSRKKMWIIIFLIAAVVFLLLGAASSYYSSKMQINKIHYNDSLLCSNNTLNTKVDILSDTSAQAKTIRAKIERNKIVIDSLNKINALLNRDITIKDSSLTYVAYNYIDASIEADLKATGSKPKSIPELNFKRLRRAVFFSILDFGGDPAVLKKALKIYQKEYNDLEMTDKDISAIVRELPNLMRIKKQWLKDEVIPALESAINDAQKRSEQVLPNGQRNQEQQQQPIEVEVLLPTSIVIIHNDRPSLKFNDTQLSNLKREVDLIERLLSKI